MSTRRRKVAVHVREELQAMSWLLFAFCGPLLWAISTHLDKYLLERYFKQSDAAVLLVFTAFAGVLLLPFIWLFQPAVFHHSPGSLALMVLSGILYMVATLFYLRALLLEEASAVAPFFQASPLFGYSLGYLVLGETLSPRQIAGGALIIIGTVIVSVRFDAGAAPFKLRLALLMIACSFLVAVSTLIFKIFALEVEFWTTTFWMFVGEALFGAALLVSASFRQEFMALLRTNTAPLLAVNGANELINVGGILGNRYALMLAPLSIVQAIGSTTTLFVFAIGVALTLLLPQLGRETLSARDLIQKGAAAVLVALGVALVTR